MSAGLTALHECACLCIAPMSPFAIDQGGIKGCVRAVSMVQAQLADFRLAHS